MDLIGIEPMTSSMPWKRAPSCATGPLLRKDSSILADEGAFVNARAIARPSTGTFGAVLVSKSCRVSEHSAAGGAVPLASCTCCHHRRTLKVTP